MNLLIRKLMYIYTRACIQVVQIVQSVWCLPLPPVPDIINDIKAVEALPIANSPGKLNKVYLLGSMFLNAGGNGMYCYLSLISR